MRYLSSAQIIPHDRTQLFAWSSQQRMKNPQETDALAGHEMYLDLKMGKNFSPRAASPPTQPPSRVTPTEIIEARAPPDKCGKAAYGYAMKSQGNRRAATGKQDLGGSRSENTRSRDRHDSARRRRYEASCRSRPEHNTECDALSEPNPVRGYPQETGQSSWPRGQMRIEQEIPQAGKGQGPEPSLLRSCRPWSAQAAETNPFRKKPRITPSGRHARPGNRKAFPTRKSRLRKRRRNLPLLGMTA